MPPTGTPTPYTKSINTDNHMATTSFAYGESYSINDRSYEDCEHDDFMDADDYDARRWERDGWATAHQYGGWR
jgi:hypothetical protein